MTLSLLQYLCMRDDDLPHRSDERAEDDRVLARLAGGDTCTLDELAELADRLLADATAADGRIGTLDGRTVRYYTTNGLLPRPFIGSDRRARYGRDHLVRLLAVRRLQAGGVTLADVHRHLAGVDADTVERLAQLPGAAPEAVATPVVRPFWATPPAAPLPTTPSAGTVVVLAPGLRLVSDTPLDVPAAHVLAAAAPLLALLNPKEHTR